MAAKTFQETTATSGKYLWSTDANWGGTKPVAGDTVTIPAGTTCTLDVAIALGTGSGTAMTIEGTLDLPTDATTNSYGFTLTGNVAGTGTISAGNGTTDLPLNLYYYFTFSGAFGFTGAIQHLVYATHPTNKWVRAASAVTAADTHVHVVDDNGDAVDLTSDGLTVWGSELVTNGDMELDANWANAGSPTTNERSTTQTHGGTYSRKFVSDSADDGIRGDTFTTVAGNRYILDFWIYPSVETVRLSVINGANDANAVLSYLAGLTVNQWNHVIVGYTEAAGKGGAGAYVKLVSTGAGQTFYVDDVSIKTGWHSYAGQTIRVDDVNQTSDSEAVTCYAVSYCANGATAADRTVVNTSAIAAAKSTNSYVIAVARNITYTGGTANVIQAFADGSYIRAAIIPSSSTSHSIYYTTSNLIEFNGVASGGGRFCATATPVTLSGIATGQAYSAFYGGRAIVTSTGVISGTGGFQICPNVLFFGTMSGSTYCFTASQNIIFDGTITNCSNAFVNCSNIILAGGSITGCTGGLNQCSAVYGNSTTFNNVLDLKQVSNARLFNCTLSGTTENYEYNTSYMLGNEFVESFDHDGVADAYKAWSKGGIITSETDTPPTGYTNYYLHTANWTYVCFRQKEIDVEPGKTITVSGYIKCAPYVDASSYPPRLEIIDAYNDPLVDSGNSALASDQVAVASGLNLDWQAVSVQWTNPDTIARHVFVRMMNRFHMWENFQILELEAPNYPAEEDVKTGVDYGIGDEFTGTLAGGGGGLLVHPGMSGGINA